MNIKFGEIYKIATLNPAIETVLNYIKNSIPKEVIEEKISEKENKIKKLHPASDCVIIDDIETEIKILKELLEE